MPIKSQDIDGVLELLYKQQYANALNIINQKWLHESAQPYEYFYLKAWCLTMLQRYAESFEILQLGKALYPKQPELSFQLGVYYLKTNHYIKAENIFYTLYQQQPTLHKNLLYYSKALSKNQKHLIAIKVIENHISKYQIALTVKTDNLFYGLANLYRDTENFSKSHELYDSLLKLKPNDQKINLSIGTAYLFQARYADAASVYTKIIECDSDYPVAYLSLAQALRHYDLEKSNRIFQMMLEKFPKYSDGYATYAYILQNNHQIEKAIEVTRLGLKNNPNNEKLSCILGYHFLNSGDLVKAEKQFQMIINSNPSYISATLGLLLAYSKNEEWQKILNHPALRAQDAASSSKIELILSIAAFCLNDLAKAEYHVQRALSIDPFYSSALSQLGHIYNGKGDNKKALQCYEKAYKTDPQRREKYALPDISQSAVLKSKQLINQIMNDNNINPKSKRPTNLSANLHSVAQENIKLPPKAQVKPKVDDLPLPSPKKAAPKQSQDFSFAKVNSDDFFTAGVKKEKKFKRRFNPGQDQPMVHRKPNAPKSIKPTLSEEELLQKYITENEEYYRAEKDKEPDYYFDCCGMFSTLYNFFFTAEKDSSQDEDKQCKAKLN